MNTTLKLLNEWQQLFPLCSRPYALLGLKAGVPEMQVIQELKQAMSEGKVSRIGGVFANSAGGSALLCALAVEPQHLERVASEVSKHPGVNHNYQRENHFNLWFVMTGSSAQEVQSAIDDLESVCAIKIMRLPLIRPYHINLGFDMTGSVAPARSIPQSLVEPEPIARHLLPLAHLAEEGLALTSRPYARWAQRLSCQESDVFHSIEQLLERGQLKRFGVIVRHHELGFSSNAMVVFDVPDELVDLKGRFLAAQSGVTLSYCRARSEHWPYNLYAMIHGDQRPAVVQAIEKATFGARLGSYPRQVLFSTRRFKQTGGRRFRQWSSPAPTPIPASTPIPSSTISTRAGGAEARVS